MKVFGRILLFPLAVPILTVMCVGFLFLYLCWILMCCAQYVLTGKSDPFSPLSFFKLVVKDKEN